MRIFRRVAIGIIGLMVALPYTNGVARAVDPLESITLSPTSKTYKVDAGQTFDDSITILNDGQTAYDFIVYTAPYSVESGSYGPDFTNEKANSDAYKWVQFAKTTWHVEPRQTVVVPYTVHVTENTSPGGHYGVIFAETQPQLNSASLARKKRVGCIMYATVSGDVHLAGDVEKISMPWFQTTAPLKSQASVRNTGNSDFLTTVDYEVSDIFGSAKYSLKNDYEVLPSTTRDITVGWDNAPWFGLYKAKMSVKVLDHTTTAETFILIMPTWLLLLVGVMVVSGGVYALRRASQKRSQD